MYSKHNSILYKEVVNAYKVQSKKKTYHVKIQRQPHNKLQTYITNDDSGGTLIGPFEKIKADGIERIKKLFTKGVAIFATAGVLYDRASKTERLSKLRTILSEGYSEEDIECIGNLLRQDKNNERLGIKSVLEKHVKCK